MRFTPDRDFGSYTIRSCQAGQAVVIPPLSPGEASATLNQDIILTHSFIIAPGRLIQDWAPQTLAQLKPEHMQAALESKPELVIVGTGNTLEFPPVAITEALYREGIGVEFMDSAAACRTYNVLMHEGRGVLAAVILD